MKYFKNLLLIVLLAPVALYMIGPTSLVNDALSIFGKAGYHDGLYISSSQLLGISVAWIVEGDELKQITNDKSISHLEITQYSDRIERGSGRNAIVYYKNPNGSFTLFDKKIPFLTTEIEITNEMILYSRSTDYSIYDVFDILDEAYEKE